MKNNSRGALHMTEAQAKAHQERHGFAKALAASTPAPTPAKLPKPRQNATEAEYGLILEAMKRRGEIIDYRPFGIKLEWGADPESGKPMVYSPDFLVFDDFSQYEADDQPRSAAIRLIEVKGGYIHPQDWIRFKGCRSAWPMFRFELHQKTSEGWRKLL